MRHGNSIHHRILRRHARSRAPPAHERYAIGIAYAYGSDGVGRFPKDMPLVACLRRDVDRIEPVIWRQFEVEGGGEISLANFEKFYARGCSWADALKTLSDEN